MNLERLQYDDATKICVEEKMCPDSEKELGKTAQKEKKPGDEKGTQKEMEERKQAAGIGNMKSEVFRNL
ncbi:unnamed protein product [Strongylus vulgaris]|uniref:Uncharacterized protein n=1 Tax=Strongylus vulgaris TaxID=40348 RepID=A0A3P7ICF3_STRVU|nr:unnamed protein product [Strongylus vulgaris]